MLKNLLLPLLLVTALLTSCDNDSEKDKDSEPSITGLWKTETITIDGVEYNEKTMLEMDGLDSYTKYYLFDENEVKQYTYSLIDKSLMHCSDEDGTYNAEELDIENGTLVIIFQLSEFEMISISKKISDTSEIDSAIEICK